MLNPRLGRGYFFQESDREGRGKWGKGWAVASAGRQWGKHTSRGQHDGKNKKDLDLELEEGWWEESGVFSEKGWRGRGFVSNFHFFY